MVTKAVIVLPNTLVYKTITKNLKLFRQIPIEEGIFVRPTTTCSYDPPNFIYQVNMGHKLLGDWRWLLGDWLTLTPTIAAAIATPIALVVNDISIDNSNNETESDASKEVADKYSSPTVALVEMNYLDFSDNGLERERLSARTFAAIRM